MFSLYNHVLLYLHRIWNSELLNLELAMHGTILIKPENPHFFNSTFLTRFTSGVNWCNITSLISQYQCFLAEWCCAIVWAQTMCYDATFWLHAYIVIESRLDLTILFFFVAIIDRKINPSISFSSTEPSITCHFDFIIWAWIDQGDLFPSIPVPCQSSRMDPKSH